MASDIIYLPRAICLSLCSQPCDGSSTSKEACSEHLACFAERQRGQLKSPIAVIHVVGHEKRIKKKLSQLSGGRDQSMVQRSVSILAANDVK